MGSDVGSDGRETDAKPDQGARVYVNDESRAYFPGITVKFAIGPDRAKLVAAGQWRVVDSRGYEIGLDGSLDPGAKIFIVDR